MAEVNESVGDRSDGETVGDFIDRQEPWNAPDLLLDPSPDATAGDTDLFGIPVQKDLFGNPATENPKKR